MKDWAIQGPGLRGQNVELTAINKAEVLRNLCANLLVNSRLQALEAVRRGFWCIRALRTLLLGEATGARRIELDAGAEHTVVSRSGEAATPTTQKTKAGGAARKRSLDLGQHEAMPAMQGSCGKERRVRAHDLHAVSA